ncbi:hypothetical protein Y888_17200, partial [Mixta calida B021323]
PEAVVPCQWRRIIGSYSGLTSVYFKNMIVRFIFQQSVFF